MLTFCSVCLLSAQAGDRARTEAQARRVSDRLQALQREADALATQERTLLTDLSKLDVERRLKNEQLKLAEAGADKAAHDLETIGNQIDALESHETASRPALEARIVELYKLGSGGYARMLLNMSDLKEFGRAYRMVAELASLDRQRITQRQQNLAAMKAARAAMEARHAEMTRLQKEAVVARSDSERAAIARERLIAEIDARRDLTSQLASDLINAQQRLQQTLRAISAGAPLSADAVRVPLRPFRGALEWPVAGRVLTRFNAQAARGATPSLQNGIQISAPEDSPVTAVHDGTVAFAGPFTGYGNLVIVDHGADAYSLYGELDSIGVTQGAKVDSGQTIGTTGRILIGTPGAYFEMRVDGKPVDPLEWLKKR
jgi:septal ring factor EnvC (AmiA/AmiB activator)